MEAGEWVLLTSLRPVAQVMVGMVGAVWRGVRLLIREGRARA